MLTIGAGVTIILPIVSVDSAQPLKFAVVVIV